MSNDNPRQFPSRVRHVQPNSPVSAGNTSASTRDLEARTNYLHEIIEAIEAGQLLVRRDQALSSAVLEGMAVYWDATNKQFAPAIAAVQNDPTSGVFVTLPSSDCLGLCLVKDNPNSGTIALVGVLTMTPTDLANLIDGPIGPGRYYLSATTPGKLVQQRPPVSVAVAFVLGPADDCETNSVVFINPQMRDFLEDHIHYQFHLAAKPAGVHVPPVPGEQHVITSPDIHEKGWLPADHASFKGTAPPGAKFGYNLKADIALNRVWPPIPATAALLEMYQPKITGQVDEFDGMMRVQEVYCKIDIHGIWWMTNCYNQVPWDTNLTTEGSLSSISAESLSSESVADAEHCPCDPDMELILSFIKMTFATDKTVVTSLQPDVDQPIEFVNCAGEDANTGDLYARLKILALLDPNFVRGSTALKGISDSKLLFKQGYIVEALYAGSDAIILNGSHQELLDPTQPAGPGNPIIHQGLTSVDAQLDPSAREISPQVVKLGDALEREYENITYIGFPYNRDSAIRMRLNVPPSGLPTNPQMYIRSLMFGRQIGPWSAMTMSYYRVTRPVADTPTVVGAGDTSIAFDVVTPSTDYDGHGNPLPIDNIIEISSAQFEIATGDTIFVTLQRAETATPLFQNDIGVIRIGGIIVAGE